MTIGNVEVVEYPEGFAVIEDTRGKYIYTHDDRIVDLGEQQSAKDIRRYEGISDYQRLMT